MSSNESQAVTPPAADDPIIWRKDLRAKCGNVCSETIRLWIKAGKLPAPDVKLSLKTMGWRRSTLVARGFPV